MTTDSLPARCLIQCWCDCRCTSPSWQSPAPATPIAPAGEAAVAHPPPAAGAARAESRLARPERLVSPGAVGQRAKRARPAPPATAAVAAREPPAPPATTAARERRARPVPPAAVGRREARRAWRDEAVDRREAAGEQGTPVNRAGAANLAAPVKRAEPGPAQAGRRVAARARCGARGVARLRRSRSRRSRASRRTVSAPAATSRSTEGASP